MLTWHSCMQRADMAAAEGVAWQLLQHILADIDAPISDMHAPTQPPSPSGALHITHGTYLPVRPAACRGSGLENADVRPTGVAERAVARKLAADKAAGQQQAQQKGMGHAQREQLEDADWTQGLPSSPPQLRPEDFVVAIPTHSSRESLLPSHRPGRQVHTSFRSCSAESIWGRMQRDAQCIILGLCKQAHIKPPLPLALSRARGPSLRRTTGTTPRRACTTRPGAIIQTRRSCAASLWATSAQPSCPSSHTSPTQP